MRHLPGFFAACVLLALLLVAAGRPRRVFTVLPTGAMLLTETCEALAPCTVNLTEVSQ